VVVFSCVGGGLAQLGADIFLSSGSSSAPIAPSHFLAFLKNFAHFRHF